jgi:hypothetical protein
MMLSVQTIGIALERILKTKSNNQEPGIKKCTRYLIGEDTNQYSGRHSHPETEPAANQRVTY